MIQARKTKKGTRYTATFRTMRNGKKYSESKTFPDKTSAKAWLSKKETELKKGGDITNLVKDAGKLTISELIGMHLDKHEFKRTKRMTLESMKRRDYFKRMLVTDFKFTDLKKYCELRKKECKPQTINHDVYYLKTAYGRAKDDFNLDIDDKETFSLENLKN